MVDVDCKGCRNGAQLFPFTMAFQPIVDLESKTIYGQEALVRGLAGQGAGHVLGQLTPELLYAFDQRCRTKAIEMAAALGLTSRLSINFLPNAVYEPAACIRATLAAARKTGFSLDRLTFEIVESEQIADTAHLQRIIAEYRRHGFQIALDDFGSGYSGLERLATLRPDTIKVDRALVENCDKDTLKLAILSNLLALGREVGITVVLEGVEQSGELAALRDVGGRFIQGYYFSKPVFEGLAVGADVFRQSASDPCLPSPAHLPSASDEPALDGVSGG